jgi:aryl-alcohol dehydrogenase-like predicted oxidoreductase
MPAIPLPTRTLGSTGRVVTALGLGGEGVLRTHGRDPEAAAVLAAAIEHGLSYFDSARAYAGSEGYYGRFWAAHPEARAKVFITSKSASRDAAGARRDLSTTLGNLGVDHLDLWQIHDVREDTEIAEVTRRGGALEAFLEAKAKGRVRHLGVTGHHDPRVLLRAVRELPVETVLLPVNPVEGAIGGFLTEVVPEARRRGMGVVGMKALGQRALLEAGFTAQELVRWALAEDVDTVIVGCSTPGEVAENVASASAASMSAEERRALVDRVRRHARRLAYYRGHF